MFLSFQARRSSAKRSSTSDLTVVIHRRKGTGVHECHKLFDFGGLQNAVAYAEGGSGGSPPENFWIFRLKNTRFLSFEAPYPMYFHGWCYQMWSHNLIHATSSGGGTILLFFHACSECIPTGSLQGRKLVIDWKTWDLHKALRDDVEFRRENFPPYSGIAFVTQKKPTVS